MSDKDSPMDSEGFIHVNVIPNDCYSVMGVTVNEKQSKTWSYLIIVAIVVFFIVVICVICYNYFINSDSSSSTSNNDENINVGAMISASQYNITNNISRIVLESNSQCDDCDYGYYTGNRKQASKNPDVNMQECGFQSHSSNYYNVGTFDMSYDKREIGRHNLSLNFDNRNGSNSRDGATHICNNKDYCRGVEYNHKTNQSYLIMSDIQATYPSTNISSENSSSFDEINSILQENKPKLNFSKDTQVYLKNDEKPHFTNVVFGYSGTRPLRYYIPQHGVSIFPNGVQREIKHIPSRMINYGGLIGEYYNSHNELIYTDNQTGEYNLPLNLQRYHHLYVTYTLP